MTPHSLEAIARQAQGLAGFISCAQAVTIYEQTSRGDRPYDLYCACWRPDHLPGMPIDDYVANYVIAHSLPGSRIRQRHQHVHQLAGRQRHGGLGHLRHHAVRAPLDQHHLPGQASQHGRRAHGGKTLASATPSPTAALCSTKSWAACGARPATSRSRPGKSSAWRDDRRNPRKAHRPSVESIQRDSDRDFFMGPRGKDYGIVDEVLERNC